MSKIMWSILEKAKGGKSFGYSGPKKARRMGSPMGSVKVKNGKKYIKTDKGWNVMKSVCLAIPVMMKSKYLKRYRGPNGEWVYVYKEGDKEHKLAFSDNPVIDLVEDTAKAIVAEGKKNGFAGEKTVAMARKAVEQSGIPDKQKRKMVTKIVQRAIDLSSEES